MLLFFKLAWRNIFRNKRRTILSALAMGVGLASLILTDALMIGLAENMISSVTSSFLGEAQVHREGYTETREVEQTIEEKEKILETLRTNPLVKHFTPRTHTFAMVSSAANVQSLIVSGIDTQSEKNLSRIDEALVEGSYLDDNKRQILIGSKLAEILEVGLGDKVVVTAAQAETGDLSQEMFRVRGIFTFGVRDMDSSMAYISLKRAQKMLALGDNVHEIAIQFNSVEAASNSELPIWNNLSQYGNRAQSWHLLMPELSAMLEMFNFSIGILAVILFGIVAAGIINSLFMSLYERMFEFGVLRAVGTKPFHMGLLIVLEAGALSIISTVAGIIIAIIVLVVLGYTGIDYRGTEFVSVMMTELVYPVAQLHQFIIYPVLLLLFTLLISIYPAIHAARITPSKAMKRGL